MKVSKRTNRICLGLAIAALVAIFFYQACFAKATNESSYRWGYDNAVAEYKCLAHVTPDGDCGVTTATSSGDFCWSHVSNATACNDGFFSGYVHWCASDMKSCINFLKQNIGARADYPSTTKAMEYKWSPDGGWGTPLHHMKGCMCIITMNGKKYWEWGDGTLVSGPEYTDTPPIAITAPGHCANGTCESGNMVPPT